MATNYFLKIEGIDSESTNAAHSGWIEVTEFEHSLAQPVTASFSSGGAMNAERATHGVLEIKKTFDKASPKLLAACCKGDNFPKATLHLCRNTAGNEEMYYEIVLTGVVVSEVVSGVVVDEKERLRGERVALNYTKIEWKYVVTDQETGQKKGNVVASWDRKTNTGG